MLLRKSKTLAVDLYSLGMYLSGRTKLAKIRSDILLILTFHRVLPSEFISQYPLPSLAVTPDELRWILQQVIDHVQVETVSAAHQRLRLGPMTKPLLAITFDDGQRDNFLYARPILEELGVLATFYLPTDYIGEQTLLWHDLAGFAWQEASSEKRMEMSIQISPSTPDQLSSSEPRIFLNRLKELAPAERKAVVDNLTLTGSTENPDWARLMSWEEVRILASAGHEMGSHSCSHPLLPQLTPEEQHSELANSMRAIENAIEIRPRSLCYPNGDFDNSIIEIAEKLGYENAVTTMLGENSKNENPFTLKRSDMDSRRITDFRGELSTARLASRLFGLL